jgi:maleylacetate reductase
MHDFVYEALPGRVVFGAGSRARLADEVTGLGAKKVLVFSTPGRRALAEEIAENLGSLAAGIHDKLVMHVPAELAAEARAAAEALGADGYLAVGGGTTIGLAKAVAVETGWPVIALPTTYSGSEMTAILGVTEAGVKRTVVDRRVLPRLVIYDPELTLGLPSAVSAVSGINGIAHAVEALYGERANPITSMTAEAGIAALARALPAVVRAPDDLEARGEALYGAWLCGAHAETHTIVLPHAAAYNRAAAPHAMARVARALGTDDGPGGLYDLALALGAKTALKDLGMAEDDLDQAARIATQNPYRNPRPITYDGIRALLDDAYHGRRPA